MTSSPTTAPGSTTTGGSASSSPNSRPSASTSPTTTPAGTADQPAEPEPPLQIAWTAPAYPVASTPAAPHLRRPTLNVKTGPGQTGFPDLGFHDQVTRLVTTPLRRRLAGRLRCPCRRTRRP